MARICAYLVVGLLTGFIVSEPTTAGPTRFDAKTPAEPATHELFFGLCFL